MGELKVEFDTISELLDCFDLLKQLIQEGYTCGNILNGWELTGIEGVD